ncbi:MAG TPA: sulfurtransferase [Planctomycetota bacterium]|nr:sulfurtransferase [Planctomycetota bacterium]
MRFLPPAVLFAASMGNLALSAPDGDYPRRDLLVEPANAAKPELRDRAVLLDARDRKKYEEGHAAGAVLVDAAAWAKAFGDGKDAAGWTRRIGALGLSPGSTVVVYDDAASKDAARIWWILRYWGFEDARLLNGGWKAWKAAGLPVETGAPKARAASYVELKPQSERLATKARLLESIKKGDLQVLDARSTAEHCGTEKTAKRAGAIPGAKHLDWVELIDKKTERFKHADELRRLFKEAGIDLAKPAAAHCQSGGRASVAAFAMELMGSRDVSNYHASWAEWGNADDTPVVPGKAKGAAGEDGKK